jgi:hypothetical protein
MRIGSDYQLQAGPCEQAAGIVQPAGQQFTEMVYRFAQFETVTANESVVFRGLGEIESPAWQRAILAWAHWTYAEVITGQICAACRTVFSWGFVPNPDQPGFCTSLVVLDYGYAYAETSPCEGGGLAGYLGGWLETGEWETMDSWLTTRAAYFTEENMTFAGTGTVPLAAGELDALAAWANAVYDRLVAAGEVGSGQGG